MKEGIEVVLLYRGGTMWKVSETFNNHQDCLPIYNFRDTSNVIDIIQSGHLRMPNDEAMSTAVLVKYFSRAKAIHCKNFVKLEEWS